MSKKDIQGFRGWLQDQTKREDRVGDFARDFLVDSCAADVRSTRALDRHLQDAHGATDDVLDSHHEAWGEYTVLQGDAAE